MTRKDYIAIAAAFSRTQPDRAANSAWFTWANAVTEVAEVLAADNPRFDYSRFIEACEEASCE